MPVEQYEKVDIGESRRALGKFDLSYMVRRRLFLHEHYSIQRHLPACSECSGDATS